MKILILITIAAVLGGCEVYDDGHIVSSFDQAAIKAELMKADREYGNNR